MNFPSFKPSILSFEHIEPNDFEILGNWWNVAVSWNFDVFVSAKNELEKFDVGVSSST